MSRRRSFVAVGVVAVFALCIPWPAHASEERILGYDVAIEITSDGLLHIVETIDYDFGDTAHHGIYRDVPTRYRYDDRFDRLEPLRVDAVNGSPGTPVDYTVEDAGGGMTRIKIGDPDRTISGRHRYVIAYTVQGALNRTPDGAPALVWNAVGADWSVPIENVTVRVDAPGRIGDAECVFGPAGSTDPCDDARTRGSTASFAQAHLNPYEAVTFTLRLPPGAVTVAAPILEERWTLQNVFRGGPVRLGAALLVLVLGLGAVAGILWRRGRDRQYVGSPIDQVMGNADARTEPVPFGHADDAAPPEFAPPGGIRPGMAALVLDGTVKSPAVAATIVDLAVRGGLVIEEVPGTGWLRKKAGDWRLRRTDRDLGTLEPYEEEILRGLFDGADEVLLSTRRKAAAARFAQVRTTMSTASVERGWFAGNPARLRLRWTAAGFGIAGLCAVIAWFVIRGTSFGWLGVAVAIVGVTAWVWYARTTPRTAAGTAMCRRLRGYRTVIKTADQHLAQWAEQENVFPTVLPYAIAFGLTTKWIKAFEGLQEDPTSSPTMGWWVPSGGGSIDSFSATLTGFTTATGAAMAGGSSGGGGGGGAGGGGGGGGGGSW